MDIDALLKEAFKYQVSDIHLKIGQSPIFRVHGDLRVTALPKLTAEMLSAIANKMMEPRHKEAFERTNDIDLAYAVPGVCRFRVNIFRQRGDISLAMRTIQPEVKPMDELYLPEVLKEITAAPRGLILLTGTTGSGKSTTVASMIDYINSRRACHIVTIEDPIEYYIRDKKSIINQREVGKDTDSFNKALRAALRQDPDIIFVGEMRDIETMRIAITAAETGHLVFSTIHTLDAPESINRILSMYPIEEQDMVRHQLVNTLQAVISQRLLKGADGKSRIPAVEVLRNTLRVQEIIEKKESLKQLLDVIKTGFSTYKMQSFDQSLMDHYKAGRITLDQALENATSPQNFKLRLKGVVSSSDAGWDQFGDVAKSGKDEGKK